MAGQERYILDSREYVDLVVYTLKKKNPIITSCNIRTYIFFYHRDIENIENIKINDFYFIYFFFFSVYPSKTVFQLTYRTIIKKNFDRSKEETDRVI